MFRLAGVTECSHKRSYAFRNNGSHADHCVAADAPVLVYHSSKPDVCVVHYDRMATEHDVARQSSSPHDEAVVSGVRSSEHPDVVLDGGDGFGSSVDGDEFFDGDIVANINTRIISHKMAPFVFRWSTDRYMALEATVVANTYARMYISEWSKVIVFANYRAFFYVGRLMYPIAWVESCVAHLCLQVLALRLHLRRRLQVRAYHLFRLACLVV